MSTRPWEEDWEMHPLDWRSVVRKDTGEVVFDVRVPAHENGQKVAALAAASKDLAVALLEMVCNDERCASPTCRNGRAALKKAGVLP